MFKQIKGVLLGGHFSYYITKDKKYFIKLCKEEKEWITKEFFNLKKYWNKLGVKNLQLAEPIKYSLEKDYIVTRFIEGKRLVELLDPRIHFLFGKILKNLHKNGLSHSHIELTDILYKNGSFTLVDVPFFNELPPVHDLVTIKMCVNVFRLKQPLKWYKYNKCFKEFIRGYQLENRLDYEKDYKQAMDSRIRYMFKMGKKNKVKGYILKFLYKIRLF